MQTPQIVHLNNEIVTICELTPEDVEPIWQEVRTIQTDFSTAVPWNHSLQGNIQNEYLLQKSHDHLENLAKNMAYNVYKHPAILATQTKLRGSWVNFQRKYEFNPPHVHDGDYVCVIYLQCPYTRQQELSMHPNIPPDKNVYGCLCLQYTDIVGRLQLKNINTDHSFENKMLLFPAALTHSVFPFCSSDEYRITVSGNLYVDSSYYQ